MKMFLLERRVRIVFPASDFWGEDKCCTNPNEGKLRGGAVRLSHLWDPLHSEEEDPHQLYQKKIVMCWTTRDQILLQAVSKVFLLCFQELTTGQDSLGSATYGP
ncbi:hypothetical protein Y1Q_0021839 [Alligator mississippiensis]|uniref:Uncharacterized protein n=1 Tax=Alligator mississippiensis TaxID=8496 RepID=A0A151PBI2_ALLMI|nr:hypothetical protein Y1Q_0021839 [Alligator mississippiensis]